MRSLGSLWRYAHAGHPVSPRDYRGLTASAFSLPWRSAIAMAKSLNLKVVAEGVETEEQLKFTREKGCELVQGFLFSKPLPADEIPNVVTSPLVLKEDL
ncbi:MAG: EAL domain-containing protein [Candidatus Sedimenticola sp. (ex Thyasira tokunagai)]